MIKTFLVLLLAILDPKPECAKRLRMMEEEPAQPGEEKHRARKRGGCLWRLLLIGFVIGLLLLMAADYVFNLRSNATYLAFRYSKAPLEARLPDGSWKSV